MTGQRGWEEETLVSDEIEDAEIETEEDIDDPKWADRHWLLIVGCGLVVLGLLFRWMVKKR